MTAPAPAKSIQKKLIASSVAVLAAVLIGFLATVILINVSLASRQKDASVTGIRNGLLAKGNILVLNNSQALAGMVADNGFLGVAHLVATTVRDDEDVIYGIYMDKNRQPWVRADSGNPEGGIAAQGTLDDTVSRWAAGVSELSHRRLRTSQGDVYEFVAPVKVGDEAAGVIRYGLTTARMDKAIRAAYLSARQALEKTIAVLILLGCLAILFAYFAARNLARRITRPIEELQVAANAIARGDYARPITVSSDDEIGLLAADFDAMRRTVREYTERLEEMVSEKIQEIKDILDNIEQGLFTVDLDGKVNPDYALSTNAILGIEDVSKSTLGELFRLDGSRESDWMDWLDMVKQRHVALRWEKLVRLCPVRELKLSDGQGGERIILVGYQKMFNGQERLHKLMVLVQDVTDARRIERMIREEKERHENEVKSILGIVRYAAFIPDFLEDLEMRMANLGAAIHRAPASAGPERVEILAAMSRDLHTLKGTSATYGFEALSRLARESEEALAAAREPGHPEDSQEWAGMARFLERMDAARAEIVGLVKTLTGTEGEPMVRIPGQRIRDLRALGGAMEHARASAAVDPAALAKLLRACRSIDHVRMDKLADKYRAMLERVGERLGKRLEFRVRPEGLEVSPGIFAALDEPLVHILRNAADHGIEGEAKRLLSGKPGTGRIELGLHADASSVEVTVTDDGGGIDVDRLAGKALAKGLVTAEALAGMDAARKAELIFLPGLSSRDESTEISGMGVGMDAVAAWAKAAGGRIEVRSRPGEGTSIVLRLPPDFGNRD